MPNFHIKQAEKRKVEREKEKVYFISQTMDLGLVISSITSVCVGMDIGNSDKAKAI